LFFKQSQKVSQSLALPKGKAIREFAKKCQTAIVLNASGPRNPVFLRKYLVAAPRFGNKPGFEEPERVSPVQILPNCWQFCSIGQTNIYYVDGYSSIAN
jgi:hypothetical protein